MAPDPAHPNTPPRTDADVVVIGAGIAGVSAAAELAAEARVVLVEQEPLPAQHASGRSASVLSETSGHPHVCALARLSRPFFEVPPDGFADHPLLSQRGLVWVGEAGDEPLLDRLALDGVRVSPSVARLRSDEVRRLLPTFSDAAIAGGGVHEPDAMAIDTAGMIEGYLRLLRHRGGSIVTSAEAVSAHRSGSGWEVTAGHHHITAVAVVNAAGGWGDVVAVRSGVRPLGLRALRRTAAIAPAPDSVREWPLVMDIAGRYYCEPESGGLLISPADETAIEPCDATADEIDVAIALDRVREATGLPLRSIRRAWAGLRTFAPDRCPVLGEDPDAVGFWWLVGQGGAGIKTAPAMATVLVALMQQRALSSEAVSLGITVDALSPARFR